MQGALVLPSVSQGVPGDSCSIALALRRHFVCVDTLSYLEKYNRIEEYKNHEI